MSNWTYSLNEIHYSSYYASITKKIIYDMKTEA
jgi:hypothetical protein